MLAAWVYSECFNLFYFYRYVLEKVDLVIVGAEGVVESGGIINKVSFQWSVKVFRMNSGDPE